jgi:hypothetical protein
MNFDAIFTAGYAIGGLEWYYAELEYPSPDTGKSPSQLESVKKSYDFLAKSAFVK